MFRRISALGASAAALTCLILAGSAQAAPTTWSGTVANGSCTATRDVAVSGPSRIEIRVSSTSASEHVYGQIVRPDGSTAANGSYDTPNGGTYAVRVCSVADLQDPPTMQFQAIFASSPAGQHALPQAQGEVLGTTTVLSHSIHGTGAIRTHSGLAWFTVKLGPTGLATLTVYNPVAKTHMLFTRAHVSYGKTTVRITHGTMKLTLLQSGVSEKIMFRSPRFRTSGWVIKGNFIVI
jgi:hypothetical protein